MLRAAFFVFRRLAEMMDNYNKLRLAGPCLYYASFILVMDKY